MRTEQQSSNAGAMRIVISNPSSFLRVLCLGRQGKLSSKAPEAYGAQDHCHHSRQQQRALHSYTIHGIRIGAIPFHTAVLKSWESETVIIIIRALISRPIQILKFGEVRPTYGAPFDGAERMGAEIEAMIESLRKLRACPTSQASQRNAG
ncbi:MAG TPA: hypothetical protein VGJ26_16300 [Pirellulales bacterium]